METTYNMTKGRIAKQLLYFFFLMFCTNLLQQIYSFVDMVIVGKGLGDVALGAIGNLTAMSLFIIGFSTGMTNGFSVLIAQSYGAANDKALKKSIICSVRLCVGISVVLTACGVLLLRPVFVVMQTTEQILEDSLQYGYIILGGLSVTVAYNMCAGILRSFGDSRTPFTAIVISSAINIVLDYALIFYTRAGVAGAAGATVFSQAVATGICYRKIRKIEVLSFHKEDFEQDLSVYRELLKNGILAACMNSVTAVGCMVVQRYVNHLGVIYTSAYAVCNKYLNLFMLPAFTLGMTVSPFVSQNYGAKQFQRIREGMRICVVVAVVSHLIFGLSMCAFARELAGFMLNEEETILLAIEYLQICGLMLILLNLLFVYRSCVQGMGYPFIPMCSGIAEMLLRIAIIMLFLSEMGFRATAYAEAAAWVGALALNAIAYIVLIHRGDNSTGSQALR